MLPYILYMDPMGYIICLIGSRMMLEACVYHCLPDNEAPAEEGQKCEINIRAHKTQVNKGNANQRSHGFNMF